LMRNIYCMKNEIDETVLFCIINIHCTVNGHKEKARLSLDCICIPDQSMEVSARQHKDQT
jgi:hypothetical protein